MINQNENEFHLLMFAIQELESTLANVVVGKSEFDSISMMEKVERSMDFLQAIAVMSVACDRFSTSLPEPMQDELKDFKNNVIEMVQEMERSSMQ